MTVEKINLFPAKIWNDKMSILRAVYLERTMGGGGWTIFTHYVSLCVLFHILRWVRGGTSTRGKMNAKRLK